MVRVCSITVQAMPKNMFAKFDNEENRNVIFDEIIDHRSTALALTQSDTFVVTSSGNRRPRQNTKGWDMIVQWKDISTTWVPLKDMK